MCCWVSCHKILTYRSRGWGGSADILGFMQITVISTLFLFLCKGL